jgi:acetyltransferase-like isoleucine patch superfamily enzyme
VRLRVGALPEYVQTICFCVKVRTGKWNKYFAKAMTSMLAMFTCIKRLVSFHKYPRYLVDFYVCVFMRSVWKSQGMILGNRIVWLGKPVMTTVKGASISIGDESVICSRTTQTALGVNHPVIIRALKPGAVLSIGSKVRMSGVTICAATRVAIGDRCVIGANATIVDTDFHSMDPLVRSSPNDAADAASKPVIIGNDVFIGGSSIILKGVTVGNGAVIGSNSVLTKNVPAGTIVAGNPAKPVGVVRYLQDNNNG